MLAFHFFSGAFGMDTRNLPSGTVQSIRTKIRGEVVMLFKDTKYIPIATPHEAMLRDITQPYVSNDFK